MIEHCIHHLVAAHAELRPNHPAVTADGTTLTYRQLDDQANQLANRLAAAGVRHGDVVGLLLPRSAGFIVAALATLKAGAAYVPLDPRYPADRLRLMLATTHCSIVLSTPDLRHTIPESSAAGYLEARADSTDDAGHDEPTAQVHPDDIAYIMFTSGSTGTPKAVMVPHRGIVGLLRDGGLYPIGPDDTALHATSVSFDAAAFDIWGALLNGAQLVVVTATTPSVLDIAETISTHQVTAAMLPTGMFHLMVDECLEGLSKLRCLLVGGDVLSSTHARRFLDGAPGVRLINAYGPTETTFASTVHIVSPDQEPTRPVPIGRPVPQADIHIMDENLHEVSPGTTGQLFIGGKSGPARGYMGDPALTAQRFIPDPWTTGGRLYATGDLMRELADGTLEFLGRADNQIKRRGYRIELGEVELAVRADPNVRDAVVVLDGDTAESRRLVACVVGKPAADLTGLRTRLATALPEYLLPDLILPVEALPVTTNGKIDRAALQSEIPNIPPTHRPAEEPNSDEEAIVASIWAEVLELEHADLHDDFFDLGGHSLLANKIVTHLHKQLGIKLNMDAIFDYPTIAELADHIRQARLADSPT
jgi:amino acid adenylation domain-containing protein